MSQSDYFWWLIMKSQAIPNNKLCKKTCMEHLHTFIISLDSSCIVAWISGTFTNCCMYRITSLLFSSEPASRRVAVYGKIGNSTYQDLAQ